MMSELALAQSRMKELTENFFRCSEAEQETRREEYRQIVPVLLALLGEDAPGHSVDPWTADAYSDLYKDRYNHRPREYSYRTMMAFMNDIPPLEDFMDDEDEDRFDPDISAWDEDEHETEHDNNLLERVRDYEEVYGVSVIGQAMRFMDMGEYL